MRIGIDARMYGPQFTGIGRYTYELIRNLAAVDQKNEYTVFLRRDAYESFTPPSPRFGRVLADFPHYSWGEQMGFLNILNAEKLDLVHFTHFNAPIFYRRPYVVTIHDLILSFYPGKKMTGWLHRAAYQMTLRNVTRHARKVIAVSECTKKDLMRLLKLPEEKITVIYNGVSPQFLGTPPTPHADLMKKMGLSKPYFLYTGVWRDHKNIVGLLRAFQKFNQGVGGQYQLVITGRYNPTYREVPDTISKLGIEKDVQLAGLVADADLAGLYKYAAAYVFPSFYEGFGLPPLEAMACATPVIASNAEAIREVCGEGNALYFDPKNTDDMADKMRLVATDASVRQRLTDRGLERVKAFRWDAAARQVLDVYDQVGRSILNHG